MGVGVTFTQFNQIPGAMPTDRFLVEFGNIPGIASTRDLTLRCREFVWAGEGQENMQIKLHGFTRNEPGQKTFQWQAEAVFLETRNMEALRILRAWSQRCRGTETGDMAGDRLDVVCQTVKVTKINSQGQAGGVQNFVNMWPGEIQQVSMSADNTNQPMLLNCSFYYDKHTMDGISEL